MKRRILFAILLATVVLFAAGASPALAVPRRASAPPSATVAQVRITKITASQSTVSHVPMHPIGNGPNLGTCIYLWNWTSWDIDTNSFHVEGYAQNQCFYPLYSASAWLNMTLSCPLPVAQIGGTPTWYIPDPFRDTQTYHLTADFVGYCQRCAPHSLFPRFSISWNAAAVGYYSLSQATNFPYNPPPNGVLSLANSPSYAVC